MLGRMIDSMASAISPSWYANRLAHRQYAEGIKAASSDHNSMRKMLGGGHVGYEAGKSDRLKGRVTGSPHENDVPREQIDRLRWRAWNLYRNCPQAKKMSRTLGAKVVGRGMSPQPQATGVRGNPHIAFRKRAREVWAEFVKECDYRGKPGSSGQHFTPLSKTALRAAIFSGGTLFRMHELTAAEQRAKALFLPLQIQLIHVDRLDAEKHGGKFWNGLELDSEGRVVAYHVLKSRVNDQYDLGNTSERVEAKFMKHLYAADDIDQLSGTPWVGAALLTMDDRRNYEYSELTAAEMAACFVVGYRRSAGKTGGIGLNNSSGDRDLMDAHGNPLTNLQTGMVLDLGRTGELQMINPTRPNSNAEGFLNHFIRSEAVSMPGVKTSTLTGDYRQSSFSSERSADNDAWPEIEELQDWFASGFCQPIYEAVIDAAVLSGLFDDVARFTVAEYKLRRRDYLNTNWQGPVARSINPKDDATAGSLRVAASTSSPQREAGQSGRDWREILQEKQEFIEQCEELGLPESIWKEALGIKSAAPVVEPPAEEESAEEEKIEPEPDEESEEGDEETEEGEEATDRSKAFGYPYTPIWNNAK